MPLYNSLNRDILQSLFLHCVLIHFVLDGDGTDEEERNLRFGFLYTNGKSLQDSRVYGNQKVGTPSSERIIQEVDLALKELEIVYLANGATGEGLADRNGYRRKVVDER